MKQLDELGGQGHLLLAVNAKGTLEAAGTERSLEWLETQQQMQYCYLSSCLGKLN